jgi:hypothetical protein
MAVDKLLVREADGTTSELVAKGAGTDIDQKRTGSFLVDPENGSDLMERDGKNRPALPIHDVHIHWDAFNTHLHTVTGPNTTLAAAASIGDTQLTVVNSTGIASGKIFIDGATNREKDSIKVLSEATNVIQIAKPLQNAYPIGTDIKKVSLNLAKAGTRAAPVIFELTAPPEGPIHIETLDWYIETPDEPFDKNFGGGPGLANGMYMRVVSNNGATHEDRGIFRINQRFRVFGYVVEKLSFTTGPQADWASHARKNLLQDEGGIIRLDPATNDVLQVLVQDDLTATEDYTEIECVAGGHYEL